MPHAKLPRKSTNIDMTAMCDVAFLLLTFFMLATKFKPEEPVVVVTPASIQVTPIPDKDVMLLTIDKKGRIFFSIDNKLKRKDLIESVNDEKKLNLTKEEINTFALGSSIGVPLNGLKAYLQQSENTDKSKVNDGLPGIPTDTANNDANELALWIRAARNSNPALRICIKADGGANYPVISTVIKTLEHWKIFKFNLITNLKEIPPGTAAANGEGAK
ncbi:MAG: biopolymer transporter ExbD [Chitinophagia bacterium]|nr:biopolymer transporter ExbD [Chitinophagia bacterium]